MNERVNGQTSSRTKGESADPPIPSSLPLFLNRLTLLPFGSRKFKVGFVRRSVKAEIEMKALRGEPQVGPLSPVQHGVYVTQRRSHDVVYRWRCVSEAGAVAAQMKLNCCGCLGVSAGGSVCAGECVCRRECVLCVCVFSLVSLRNKLAFFYLLPPLSFSLDSCRLSAVNVL